MRFEYAENNMFLIQRSKKSHQIIKSVIPAQGHSTEMYKNLPRRPVFPKQLSTIL